MAENLSSQDFDLTDADLTEIDPLDTGDSQIFDHLDPEWVRTSVAAESTEHCADSLPTS
ncbi:MAG: hypothetical protein ABWX59_10255 [Microbacteriaceae bacterium]